MNSLPEFLNNFLYHPSRVFILCVIMGFLGVTLDGGLAKYWSLKKTEQELSERISSIQMASDQMRSQIENTKEVSFIERQAREHLDLVNEDEIVFIFSQDEIAQ